MKIESPKNIVMTTDLGELKISGIPGDNLTFRVLSESGNLIFNSSYMAHSGNVSIYSFGDILHSYMEEEGLSIAPFRLEAISEGSFEAVTITVLASTTRIYGMNCEEYLQSRFLTSLDNRRITSTGNMILYWADSTEGKDRLLITVRINRNGEREAVESVQFVESSGFLRAYLNSIVSIKANLIASGKMTEDCSIESVTFSCGKRSMTYSVDSGWDDATQYFFTNNHNLLEIAWLPSERETEVKLDSTISKLEGETRQCDRQVEMTETETSCPLTPREQRYYTELLTSRFIARDQRDDYGVKSQMEEIIVTDISSSISSDSLAPVKFKWRRKVNGLHRLELLHQSIFTKEFTNPFI